MGNVFFCIASVVATVCVHTHACSLTAKNKVKREWINVHMGEGIHFLNKHEWWRMHEIVWSVHHTSSASDLPGLGANKSFRYISLKNDLSVCLGPSLVSPKDAYKGYLSGIFTGAWANWRGWANPESILAAGCLVGWSLKG